MGVCFDWAQTGQCPALAKTGFCKFLHLNKEEADRMGFKLPGKGAGGARAIAAPCVRIHNADSSMGSMGACRPATQTSTTPSEPVHNPSCATVKRRPSFPPTNSVFVGRRHPM